MNCKYKTACNELRVQSVKTKIIEFKQELSVIRYKNNPTHLQ